MLRAPQEAAEQSGEVPRAISGLADWPGRIQRAPVFMNGAFLERRGGWLAYGGLWLSLRYDRRVQGLSRGHPLHAG